MFALARLSDSYLAQVIPADRCSRLVYGTVQVLALQDEDEEEEERPRQRNRFIDDIAAVDEDEEEEEDDVRGLPGPARVCCMKWERSSRALDLCLAQCIVVFASVAQTPAVPAWCIAVCVE